MYLWYTLPQALRYRLTTMVNMGMHDIKHHDADALTWTHAVLWGMEMTAYENNPADAAVIRDTRITLVELAHSAGASFTQFRTV